jgi:hypothetical protein
VGFGVEDVPCDCGAGGMNHSGVRQTGLEKVDREEEVQWGYDGLCRAGWEDTSINHDGECSLGSCVDRLRPILIILSSLVVIVYVASFNYNVPHKR